MSKRNANSGHRGAPRINYYQLDPDALCGLILVPNKLIAKILFALICVSMSAIFFVFVCVIVILVNVLGTNSLRL